jgi:hypothetical protein
VIDRATHRTIVMHRITPSLKAGIEWNALEDEVGIVANWVALTETRTRPALMFGTSSDRIGTPAGQSYFATLSKSLHPLPVAPYVGISYSGHADAFVFPFGVNVALRRGFSAMVMNDGVHTHLSATWARPRLSVTVLAVERRHAGVTVGTTF